MLRGPLRLDHLPGGQGRAADVAHLALAHEIVERAQGLLDRGQRVGLVLLVEVDPVGFEALEAGLDLGHDVAPRGALEPAGAVHRPGEFGRQHDVLAAVAEDLAETGLGIAARVAIGIGLVKKGDAEIERLVHDPRASPRDRCGRRNCCSRARPPTPEAPISRDCAVPTRLPLDLGRQYRALPTERHLASSRARRSTQPG